MAGKREDFIGTWEYKAEGATWRRTLHAGGQLSMQRNGKAWTAWKGFTWRYQNNKVTLHRSNKKQFGTFKIKGPGKALFTPNFTATRVETGRNTEADDIAE